MFVHGFVGVSLCVGIGFGQVLVVCMGRFCVWGLVEPELRLTNMLGFCTCTFCWGWAGVCSCMVMFMCSLCVGLGFGHVLVGCIG